VFSRKKYSYGKQSISLRDIWEVIKVLRSDWLTQGPKIQEFEKALCDYTGAKYAVAVCNGGAALHLCMLALGVKPGEEIITTPNTFLASATCVLYCGGTVKFADIDPATACIDPEQIKKQITSKTRGIIPVHFAGQPCDMQKIHDIAKQHNLFIVEDAAHAIGSEYKNSTIGSCKYSDMTIFSFHPVKTITTGEGGAITTNNKDLYEKLLLFRSYGITRDSQKMSQFDGGWYHQMIELGYNYRMSDIQAALGLSQLKRIDKFIKRRREIVELYKKLFAGDECFAFLQEQPCSKSAWHLWPILIDFGKVKITKKDLFEKLKQHGLYLQVHYIPVHTQPYFQKLGFREGDYPNAERYYQQAISLPLHPGLGDRDVHKIVKNIKIIFV
jgi:UDP-4-amino-4,6-dideoxy-N-acetyl-beta-L-altrosamine transaminase